LTIFVLIGWARSVRQLPAKVDHLSEETFAFYSHGITQNAIRYLSVPYATFLELAQVMPDPAPKLLFVWSTGRCGSTLMSQLLHTHGKVAASLSEPPAIATLHRLSHPSVVNRDDSSTWIRAVLKMLFKSWTSQDELICVKPHPVAIEAVPLLKRAAPQVKHCFLYRDSAPNVESWHSLLNSSDTVNPGDRCLPPGKHLQATRCEPDQRWTDTLRTPAGYFSIVPPELRDPFASPDYLSPKLKPKAHLHVFYCAIMHHAIRWIKAGILEKTFKYEQLVADPHAVLASLLNFAGMPFEQVRHGHVQWLEAC
jgi:hypothetical protein